jgi:hypothetical protein
MKERCRQVIRRALRRRRLQLEQGVPMDSLLATPVTKEELEDWLSEFQAPFAVGTPLKLAPRTKCPPQPAPPAWSRPWYECERAPAGEVRVMLL